MATHVLIGVGGTGAKVVEAALWMLLAGCGPREVIVGLVDQDNANGNVSRAKKLIEDIVAFRSDFGGAKKNQLDWESPESEGGCVLGSVRITPLMADPHFRPHTEGALSLSDILNRADMERVPGLTDLFDALFEKGPREQGMSLEEGYRGRAHIGSASMLASLELDDDRFKRRMEELIDRGGQSEEVRIFLAGSVFGGTGAAGFPTLARALDAIRERKAKDDEALGSNVRLGGALMLPYFGFKDAGPDANVVRTNDLLPQARAALEYYHALFADEPIFDRFYVAGWNKLFRMDYHQAGATGQKNPAMLPELLGALAALEFFEAPLGPRATDVAVMVSARKSDGEFGWLDMPAEEQARGRVFNRLGRLLRLAIYWNYEVELELEKRKNLFKQWEPWLAFLAKDIDWENDTPAARGRLRDLLRDFLNWAGCVQMSAATAGGDLDFRLWNSKGANDPGHDATPTSPVAVHPVEVGKVHVPEAFRAALGKPGDEQLELRGSDSVVAELNRKGPTARNAGLGKMLSAVHRAVRPTEPKEADAG